MIKAVIFDFGGVILRTLDHSGRFRWDARLGLPKWGAERLIFASEASTRAQMGLCPEEEVWQTAAQQHGLAADELDEFKKDFWSGDVVDRDLVDFILRLRPHYKVGLLSNAWDGLRGFLTRADLGLPGPLATLFDEMVISCEEKLMKPDPEIYRRAVARLQVAPAEAVFVDDMPANVDGARAVGLHALRHTTTAETISALAALGVSVDGREQ